ncbi:hypothetical protein O181_049043 [Austropuccinia psidii MF-1]|uniref:Uncharacterized protein n=1 Tax=Austropuccinia psidii MF-1 TaxID=1389203 RepID=A0A9Q3DWR1_9BASI|nr:hypothetical protein [Austropuccinia psidii MF-1]
MCFLITGQTRSQARAQAVPIPTSKDPLYVTAEVPQLWAHWDRGPDLEGAALSRKEGIGPRRQSSFSGLFGPFPGISKISIKGLGEDYEEEEENSGEEEESYGTEVVPAPVWESQGTGCSTLAHSNQPPSHQSKKSLLAIMQRMTQILANMQEFSSYQSSRLHL